MCEMLIAILAPVVHEAAVPVINKQKEPGVEPKKTLAAVAEMKHRFLRSGTKKITDSS